MKRLALALLLASVLLLSAPIAYAAEPSLISRAETNLSKGYHYYIETVGGWFSALLHAFARVNETTAIAIIAPYGPCDEQKICSKNTSCQPVCPVGETCQTDRLCLPNEPVGGSCKKDADCLAGCLARGVPPAAGLALRSVCAGSACGCRAEAINPDAPRIACPSGKPNYACPNGTHPACTTGSRPTCLLAPEFGGRCIGDGECAKANCPADFAPFCDTDALCRCRGSR